MSLTGFLTEGKPIEAQPYASTTETVLPDWYTNYAMDILANQNAVSSRPLPLYQGPRIAEFTPDQQAGFEGTRGAAFSFQPGLDAATKQAESTFGRSAFGAAQPFMAQAGQKAPEVIDQYLNPYLDNVVNRIGQIGTRTLKEQILPGLEGEMIRAGQFGGTRQAELTGRAIRDAMEGISAQQAATLAKGYGESMDAARADLSRMGDLARTSADVYNLDTTAGLNAAKTAADLAARRQEMGLTGASAVERIGGLQQGQIQRNLDLGYKDFTEQRDDPQNRINQLVETLKGVGPAVPKASLQQGYGSPGQTQAFGQSPLDTAISTGTGIAALLKEFGLI